MLNFPYNDCPVRTLVIARTVIPILRATMFTGWIFSPERFQNLLMKLFVSPYKVYFKNVITRLTIISFSSGRDSAIMTVRATSV